MGPGVIIMVHCTYMYMYSPWLHTGFVVRRETRPNLGGREGEGCLSEKLLILYFRPIMTKISIITDTFLCYDF